MDTSTCPPPAPPAFSRLYAQGVDLLEHKDSVFRQFGLRKPISKESALANGSSGSKTSFAASGTLQRTATSRKIVQTPAIQNRVQTQTHHTKQQQNREQRSSSAPYLSDRRVLPAGAAVAPTFSLRSTMESRLLVSPKAKFPNRRRAPSPCPASMRQSANSYGLGSQRQRQSNSYNGNPRTSHGTSARHGGASAKSPMYSGAASSSSSDPGHIQSRATMSSKTASKRASFQIPHAGNQQPRHQQQQHFLKAGSSRRDSMATQRPSVRMGVPTMSCGENPPVLIQVSRRTSSPIMTPSVAEFGMRKRPSVSPIPTLADGDPQCQVPQPRPSILMRQNSKMDKLVEQLTVLKASLGLSDEDLQWKVESTKGNAFLAVERHLSEGEERYDRLEYEVQLLSQMPCEEVSSSLVKQVRELMKQSHAISDSKPKLVASQNDIARLKKELLDAKIAAELHLAKSSPAGDTESSVVASETDQQQAMDTTPQVLQQLEDAKVRVLQIQEQLKDDISKLNDMLLALGSETDRLAKTRAEFKFMSPEVADASNQLISILKRIPECSGEKLLSLCEQAIATAQKLRGSRLRDLKKKETDLAKTMKDIEIWKARRDQAKKSQSSSPGTSGSVAAAAGTTHVDDTQEDNAPQTLQPSGSFRRVKSLQVSSEVLKFLQHDFCNSNRVNKLAPPSNGSKTGGAALQAVAAAVKIKRFASEQCIDLRSLSENEENANVKDGPLSARKPAAPTAAVRPKSKALLQLLEKEKQSALELQSGGGNGAGDAVRPPPMKMNMFSELQNRFKKKTSGSEDPNETEKQPAEEAPKKPGAMSFLDELKSKAARKKTPVDSELTPSSPQSEPREPNLVKPSSPVVDLPVSPPPAPPKSSLDELRARSRSVD